MPFALKLAIRYLRARRGSLARFTSVVAVAGIAAGVASLIVAQALGAGFAAEMRDKILANTPHVAVFREDGGEIADAAALAARIKAVPNVRDAAPAAYANALLTADDGAAAYALIRVDDRPRAGVARSEIAVGARLAAQLRLQAGDAAELLTLETRAPARVRVGGTFETGLYDYDSTWIYVAPEKFAAMRGRAEFAPTLFNVSLEDIYAGAETAAAIRAALGPEYAALGWQEANRPLFAALSLERRAALAALGLLVFVAALNITTTLALLVGERRPDIAVLRTCGARGRTIVAAFVAEGALLGLAGAAAGLALGLALCAAADHFRLVGIPGDVYELSYIPPRVEAASVALTLAGALAASLAASAYPAYRASRVRPLENLRAQ